MDKLVVFDFDGTIADTSPGIIDSFRFVANHYNKDSWSDEEIINAIGNPLPYNLKKMYGFNDDTVKEAISVYRNYYSEFASSKMVIYDGFIETAQKLKDNGYLLSIATLKSDQIVKGIVSSLDIEKLFDSVNGVDNNDNRTKSDLIRDAIEHAGVAEKNTTMIGDSTGDYESAVDCGIRFIAATYGFGLTEDYCLDNHIMYITAITDLVKKIGD